MAKNIKITFLGTGAQIPTKKRSHTAILLNYNEENILIDCGEGTQRQFRIAGLNPCKITRILITHKHGDHVFGLPGLISTLEHSGYNKTLYIYGPYGIKKVLENFLGLNYSKKNFKIVIKEVSGKFFESDDFYLSSGDMKHGVNTNAYSFVLKDKLRLDKKKLEKRRLPSGPMLKKLKEGKDITYEGKKYRAKDLTYLEKGKKISFVLDTLVNKNIVPFVKDSDLLIIESSFGDDLGDLAKEHMHLTSGQAGEIAKKAKVGGLVLTHISQRYETNLKGLISDAKKNFKNVKIANDFDEFLV